MNAGCVGVSVQNVFAVWIVLQIMEIFCMYHEMRSVVYKTFNFERMYSLLDTLLLDKPAADGTNRQLNHSNVDSMSSGDSLIQQKYTFTRHIPTPEQIAATEKIFLPPNHLARQAVAFGSPGRTMLDPDELDVLINDIFRGEHYFLVVGRDVKNKRGLSARARQWMRRKQDAARDAGRGGSAGAGTGWRGGGEAVIDPQEQCHIVLHADAK